MSLGDLLTWLNQPLSGASTHVLATGVSWHGRLMVLAWGLAVPAAALLARFWKVTPRQRWPQELDNRFWWHGHRGLNTLAVVLSVAAAALVIGPATSAATARGLHAIFGWCVLSLAAVQVVTALLRGSKGGPTAPSLRGDHYDMTARRVAFERVHKSAGWLATAAAMGALASGLWAADALRWMALGLALLWAGFIGLFLAWQRQERCLDTYQAIWGPGPEHPGHARPATGWGVLRVRQGQGLPWQR